MDDKSVKKLMIITIIVVIIIVIILVNSKTKDNTGVVGSTGTTSGDEIFKVGDIQGEYEEPEEPKEEHYGCAICDTGGGFCCSNGNNNKEYLEIKSFEGDEDISTEPLRLKKGNYTYLVEYSKKNGISKVIVDDKELFSKAQVVDVVFILKGGILGIEYHDEIDQAGLRKRIYYNSKLYQIRTIEGIKADVDPFATQYEFVEVGKTCINNEYREIKTYKATIKDGTVKAEYVKTEKENNCAGMT